MEAKALLQGPLLHGGAVEVQHAHQLLWRLSPLYWLDHAHGDLLDGMVATPHDGWLCVVPHPQSGRLPRRPLRGGVQGVCSQDKEAHSFRVLVGTGLFKSHLGQWRRPHRQAQWPAQCHRAL